MIEQAQVKGTAHLPELISDLRDPKRRNARLKEEAAALAGGTASTWLPPRTASGAPAAAPVDPRPAGSSVRLPAAGSSPGSAAPRRRSGPGSAAPVAKAAPPAPAPAPAGPPPQPRRSPNPQAAPAPPPPSPSPPRRPSGPMTDSGLADRLAAIPSLTLRFRVFRRQLNEAQGMSTAGLRSILEGFPDGWARRRALLELLRAGIPAALPDALSLIEALGSEGTASGASAR